MAGPVLSVVIPTYNEASGIVELLQQLKDLHPQAELLVIDDDSPDGTARLARQAGARVIVRKQERGLATAVVRGLQEATGVFVLVMDGDGQHPVEATARMLHEAKNLEADLVVASRYREGGSDAAFPPGRRLLSRSAAALAHLALPPVRKHGLTDPMSGFFLVRRDRISVPRLQPSGYKVLLELLARTHFDRVAEVGFTFRPRGHGSSKLGATVMLQYLVHLAALAAMHPDNRRLFKFAAVGLSGVVVNLGLLALLTEVAGLYYLISAAIAIETSIVTNFLLNNAWTFSDRQHGHVLARLARFNAVSLAALAINLATLAVLTEALHFHYLVSAAVAIGVAFVFNYVGNLNWTFTEAPAGFPARRLAPWLPFFLVVAGASWLFLHDLGHPDEMYFDENHYVSAAYQIASGMLHDPCWAHTEYHPRPINYEHPPFAKLLMAWSVRGLDPDTLVFDGCRDPDSDGYEAFEQRLQDSGRLYAVRLPGALLGIAAVVFTGLAAARLTGTPYAAPVASALVALDGLVFTSSRMAMLDIHATGFTMAALWAATYATRRGGLGAAILLALAFACKFSAAFAGPAVLLVAVYCHHRAGRLGWPRAALLATLFPVVALALLPVTYAPWWQHWIPAMGLGGAIQHWLAVLGAGIDWTANVQGSHPQASRPHEWFALATPVFYHVAYEVRPGLNEYIYGIGNPALWWASAATVLVALPTLGIQALRHLGGPRGWLRDADFLALAVASTAALSTYFGFLLLGRETYLFYMTLVVPFLALAATTALHVLWRRHPRIGATVAAAFLILVAAVFAYYYPVLAAESIPATRFRAIMGTIPWMST